MRALVRSMQPSARLVPFAVAALTVALAACVIGPKQDDPVESTTGGGGPDASFADSGEYTDPAAANEGGTDGRADDSGSTGKTDGSSDAKGDAVADGDAASDAKSDAPDAD